VSAAFYYRRIIENLAAYTAVCRKKCTSTQPLTRGHHDVVNAVITVDYLSLSCNSDVWFGAPSGTHWDWERSHADSMIIARKYQTVTWAMVHIAITS